MHWHASPRAAVGFMRHAASLDLAKLGWRRAITMPGLAVTVGEQIAALRKVAGDRVVARISSANGQLLRDSINSAVNRATRRRSPNCRRR